LGLLDLISDGIKAQFAFLKSKYYDFLGNPPYCGCDGFTPSGPVHPPAKAPNQYYFEMQNNIFYKLKGKIAAAGSSIVSDADFDKYYKKFIVEVLSRGGAAGSSSEDCPSSAPFTPYWPYDDTDFSVDGTLADDCVDESFLEAYNAVFKEGFDLAPEDLKDVSTYIEEIKEQLTATETKLLMERANRAGPAEKEAANPCCKYYNGEKVFSNVDEPGSNNPEGDDTDHLPLLEKVMYYIYESVEGLGDAMTSDEASAVAAMWTTAERCYICRQAEDFGDKGSNSLISYIKAGGKGDYIEEDAWDIFWNGLNCKEFGWSSKYGNEPGATVEPDSWADKMNKTKCVVK